jgi:hypothetical protein
VGSGARVLIDSRRLAIAGRRLRPLVAPALVVVGVGLIPVPTCLVRLATGHPCPACGLTRAGLSLLSADLVGATHWHPLALPLLLLAIATPFAALSDRAWSPFGRWAMGTAGATLIAVWLLRFAGALGGPCPQ